MDNLEKKRQEFITKLIPFVLEYGWSDEALEVASASILKDSNYYGILFDNLSSVVNYFENVENLRMAKEVKLGKEDGVRKKIATLLRFRIKEISGGIKMSFLLKEHYLSHKHIGDLSKNAWNTADSIWIAIGDKSADMNYYSKRFLLSGVYLASVRHYLSEKNDDIDEFIMHSLDRIVKIAGYKKYLKLPKLEDIPILRLFS